MILVLIFVQSMGSLLFMLFPCQS
uniref:Uncharacterized protein n=1 Tax=Arundo donax TaxID=35708 RepID=A0A0A9BQV1_ARUDO